MGEKSLQWHPGFQAALQVELEEEMPYLKFHEEYNLSEKPLQIDALIIKADPGYSVRKSMGKMFRRYNIVEYKSPDDYVSVNNFIRYWPMRVSISPIPRRYWRYILRI